MKTGTVTISPENPTAGTELTATLTDTEGGVSASGQISGQSVDVAYGHAVPTDGISNADTGNYTRHS